MSLDVLKLYHGEDVVRKNLIDPDRWLEEEELTDLPEVPRSEVEAAPPVIPEGEPPKAEVLEAPFEPYFEPPVQPENQEGEASRERIHERIPAEMYHENKEGEAMTEENLHALQG